MNPIISIFAFFLCPGVLTHLNLQKIVLDMYDMRSYYYYYYYYTLQQAFRVLSDCKTIRVDYSKTFLLSKNYNEF